MSTSSKVLVAGLVAVNLALVGLLLFRDRAVAPARAEAGEADIAPATTAATVERAGGTAFAEQSSSAPGASTASTASSPAVETAQTAAPVTAEAVAAAAPTATERVPLEVYDPPLPAAPKPRHAAVDTARGTRSPVRERDERVTAPRRLQDRDAGIGQPREEGRIASRYPEAGGGWEPGDHPIVAESVHVEREAPARPEAVTVTAGTNVPVKLDVALHSRQIRSGDEFEASLAEDLMVDGKRVGRSGDAVTGRVIEVQEAGRVQGKEQMRLTLSQLTLAGRTYPVQSSIATFTAPDDHNRDGAMVGGASLVGAIIGGIAKGGRGAAAGAATGAAAGAGVVLGTKGKPVVLAAGTRLDFTLAESVRVTLPAATTHPHPEEHEEPGEGGVARR